MALFNSSFEMQLRILLLLAETPDDSFPSDHIVAIDFMSIYGAEFGISNLNLHGDSRYKFSEIASRRVLVQDALKELVLKGLVQFELNDGYRYKISDLGLSYECSLESTYANAYRVNARKALAVSAGKEEHELMKRIQEKSVISIREGT